jgi:hypothetical protein
MPDRHGERHDDPASQLATLAFLEGDFRGEGSLADSDQRYEKDVTGRWVAGGHHLILEMVARYFDGKGRRDEHSAVVVVSADNGAGLSSAAYTDGGEVMNLVPKPIDDGLQFDDEVPHGSGGVRARKILRPTDRGYREIFEVDRGDGQFNLYASVDLHRIEA